MGLRERLSVVIGRRSRAASSRDEAAEQLRALRRSKAALDRHEGAKNGYDPPERTAGGTHFTP